MIKKIGFGFAISALMLLTPALTRMAEADQISTFNVKGTAENNSGGTMGTCADNAVCSFSGTLSIDTTAGNVTGVNLVFPGLQDFSVLIANFNDGLAWKVDFTDILVANLGYLSFSTAPTSGSLVAFTGGTIGGGEIVNPSGLLYIITGGNITPSVPEPGSLALLAVGMLGLGFAGWRRKQRAMPLA